MTFEDAYRTHRKGVHRHASRWCTGYSMEPDDVVQETFAQAINLWTRRQSENVFAWLIGIARRVFWHMCRESQAVKRGGKTLTLRYEPELDGRAIEPPQEIATWVNQLREKFSALGPAQEIALRGVADGHTPAEIAEASGVSAASVRMALSLGRRRLIQMGF